MAETAKTRILQFVDIQNISIRKFCEKNSFSPTIFSQKGAIGSDKLETIANNYKQLNMLWVLTGKGEMILDPERNEWKEKYYDLLERHNNFLEGKSLVPSKLQLNEPEPTYKTKQPEK